MKVSTSLHGGRAVVIALLIGIVTTLLWISLITGLILSGSVSESASGLLCGAGLFLSSLIGATVAARGGDTKIAIRIATLGAAYALTLLTTGLLILDGPFVFRWINGLCILLGCVTSCAICIRKRKIGRRRKKAIR